MRRVSDYCQESAPVDALALKGQRKLADRRSQCRTMTTRYRVGALDKLSD